MAVRTASYYAPPPQAGKPVGVAMLEYFWITRFDENQERHKERLRQLNPDGLRKERIALYAERQKLEDARAKILSDDATLRAQAITDFNKAQVDIFKGRATLTGKRIEAGQRGYTAEKKRESESRAARAIGPETRAFLHDQLKESRNTRDDAARAEKVLNAVNTAMTMETGVLGGGSKLEKFDTLLLEAFIALDGDPEMQIAVMRRVRPNQPAAVEVNGKYYPVNFPQEYQDRYGGDSDAWLQLQAYRHWQKYGVGDPSLMAPVAAGATIGENALASINNAILDIDAEMKGLRRLEGRSREEYDALREKGFDPLAPIRRKAWEGEAMIDRVARLQQIDPDRAKVQLAAARAKYEGKGVPASPLVRRIEQGIRTARGEEIEMPEVFQGVGTAGNMVDYIQTETDAILGLLEGDDDQKRQAIERAWELNDTLHNPLVQGQVEAIGFLDLESGERVTIADEQSGLAGYMREAQEAMDGGDATAMYEWIAAGINDVQGAVSANIQENPDLHRLSYLGNTYEEVIRGTLESGQEEDYDAYGQRLAGIQHSLNALPEALRGEAGDAIVSEINRMEDHGDRRYMESMLTGIAGGMGTYRGAPAAPRPPAVVMQPEPAPAGPPVAEPAPEPAPTPGATRKIVDVRPLPAPEPTMPTPGEVAAEAQERFPTDPDAPRPSGVPRDKPDIGSKPPSVDPEVHRPPPATYDRPDPGDPRSGPSAKVVQPSRVRDGETAQQIAARTSEEDRGRRQAEEQRRQQILRKGGGEPEGEFDFLNARRNLLDWRATMPAPTPEPAPQPTTTTTISGPTGMDPISPPMNIQPGQSVPETGKDRYGGKYQGVHRRSNVDPGKVISTRWYPEKEIVHQWEQRLNSEGVVLDSTMAKRARSTGGDLEQQMYAELVGTVRSGSR